MLLLSLGGWAFLAAAPPSAVAIAPIAVERVSLEEVPLYEELDDLLRSEAASAPGLALQDEATTRAHMEDVRDAGIDCAADDASCMSKVAVLAGVQRFIVPIARREGERLHLRLLVVDGSGGAAELEGTIAVAGDDPARSAARRQAAKGLMERALTAPIPPPGASTPPTPEPSRGPAPADPSTGPPAGGSGAAAPAPASGPSAPGPAAPAAAAPAVDDLPVLGLGMVGGGGLLLLGGGAAALAMNEVLATPERFEDRVGYMIAGQVSLALAGVGVAAVGLGAVLLVTGP